MLDWTRLERGELGLKDSVAPVPELVKKAISLIPAAGQRVDVSPMDQLPALRCDPRYVVQVLAHVIDNAVTFSPEGESVSVSADLGDERNLVVRVTDQGPGLTDETRVRAFGAFEKFDPAGDNFVEGIGLGLPISRKLMEIHGGGIELIDGQECGSTVVLAFPAHRTVL